MKLTVQTFLAGVVLGAIFSLLNLQIPAPPTLAGVMGVVGTFIGFVIIQRFSKVKNNRESS
ncbi:XapX domain-containing protein [Ornithinibacillus halophilus]|uniref:PEP-CTERM protein-sorting domain-containing protein/XapX domain-containing protein n=1 Tax=Ornithinibacillus halophilus TaxID=930117 RepID=A0A1M5KBQ5_9BACI|nr:DUF1427 family protein [Ornithinibacillus halophilus]SHG49929.1 PEP-CTERM protein-sorting domain-containing protein/XapX domain-containing protein [Ornithinibacillus halophilus]